MTRPEYEVETIWEVERNEDKLIIKEGSELYIGLLYSDAFKDYVSFYFDSLEFTDQSVKFLRDSRVVNEMFNPEVRAELEELQSEL